MERRARWVLGAATLLLCTAAKPSLAGWQTQVYNDTTFYTTYRTYVPGASLALAMDRIDDCKLRSGDIVKILPLLYDLRAAENREQYNVDLVVYDPHYTYKGTQKLTRMEMIDESHRRYENKATKIWNIINDRIGSEKANCLRDLCEWKKDDMLAYVPDEHLKRIDVLIAQWDDIHARTVAANGGVDANKTVEATFVTKSTTPSTYVSPYEPVYFSPTVTVNQLCTILENRMLRSTVPPEDMWMIESHGDDFDGTYMRYLNERIYRIWD